MRIKTQALRAIRVAKKERFGNKTQNVKRIIKNKKQNKKSPLATPTRWHYGYRLLYDSQIRNRF